MSSLLQLVEKHTRRLQQMYQNMFRLSRDPKKGYQATYNNSFAYSIDDSQAMMEETVTILSDGDFVVRQLWPTVQNLISYSLGLMSQLFSTLGVSSEKRSPFCRKFSSLDDLRDEFIYYFPRSFAFGEVSGMNNEVEAVNPDAGDDANPNEESILERAKRFAKDIAELSKEKEKDDAIIFGDDNGDSDIMTREVAWRRLSTLQLNLHLQS